MTGRKSIPGTAYCYDVAADGLLLDVNRKVEDLRAVGRLTPAALKELRDYFRLKNIYNSNAIEGNVLDYNETRMVVEEGLTISGKPLKDTLEAKNLSQALTLFEELADRQAGAILETDVRSLHAAVLKGVNDRDAGKYRDVEVAITGSKHRPPGPESVAPEMQRFGRWLKDVTHPAALTRLNPLLVASVAHTWFVSIHPFIDGNGRVARLLLNLMLMRFGHPIAVITKEDRHRYYEALGESDQTGDLSSLLGLVLESVEESLEEYLAAAKEQRTGKEWASSLLSGIEKLQLARTFSSDYSVWKSAMELLKNQFRRTADVLNELNEENRDRGMGLFDFKEFGLPEFEKYVALRGGRAGKKTWFFAVDTHNESRRSRYLLWCGLPSPDLKRDLGSNAPTLHVSFADESTQLEMLERSEDIRLPSLCEIGYNDSSEQFYWRSRNGQTSSGRVEEAARPFFKQIAKRLV